MKQQNGRKVDHKGNGSLSQIMSDNYGLFRRGALTPIAYLAVDAQAAHRSVVLSECTDIAQSRVPRSHAKNLRQLESNTQPPVLKQPVQPLDLDFHIR